MVYVRILCITANIGSLADEYESILHDWTKEIAHEIEQWKAELVAIHLQRIGGLTGKTQFDMKKLAEKLQNCEPVSAYQVFLGFADEEGRSSAGYTGLASIYLLKNSDITRVWDFKGNDFITARGYEFAGGNLQKERFVIKESFSAKELQGRDINTEGKGFLRSRFVLHGQPINFVNTHVYGDGSNITAAEKFPSVYAEQRQETLKHLLKRLEPEFSSEPVIIGGDLNCRLDLNDMLKGIAKLRTAYEEPVKDDSGAVVKIDYMSMSGKVACIQDHNVDFYGDHEWLFSTCNGQLVKKYNKELASFQDVLHEAPIPFQPSFPYDNDRTKGATQFSRKTCPAWRDRIVTNASAWNLIKTDSFSASSIFYNIIGAKAYMGEHKPVFMSATLNIPDSPKTYSPVVNGPY